MTTYDLAILGAGPSGLAAASFALTAHLNVVLIAPDLGGKVNYSFALRNQAASVGAPGADMVKRYREHVANHTECLLRHSIQQVIPEGDLFKIITDADPEGNVIARSLIVATGAEPQRLHIPGESEYWGRGVSFSAISHAPLFRDHNVVVMGHGDRFLVAGLKLAHIARHVYLLPTMNFDESEQRITLLQEHPRVEFMSGWQLTAIRGDEYVTEVTITREYEIKTLAVEGVFIERGLSPNRNFIRDVVEFDPETGQIPINQRCETSVPGLFAAGDVTDIHAEQIPVAIGEGIKAANSAWEYLVSR